MKSKILSAAILLTFNFLLLTSFSFAQWEMLYPKPTNNDLEDVFFIDDFNAWAVGENGTIIHTNDGGVNWAFQDSGTELRLRSVIFTDLQTGWIVGGEPNPIPGEFIILHTSDGGSNWNIQKTDNTSWLKSVFFIDSSKGWAVGENGAILHTNNGGADWISQWSWPTYIDFNEVFFVDSLNGWIAGESGLYNTINGGLNWDLQITNVSFSSVFFISSSEGWASTESVGCCIVHTIDSGNTWETLSYWIGYESSMGNYSIFFKDRSEGWMLHRGIFYGGWITTVFCDLLKTYDGGLTWVNIGLPTALSLNSVHFSPDGSGSLVGDRGIIFKSCEWGDEWQQQSQGNSTWLYSIAFPDMMNGWAVGSDRNSSWWGDYVSVIIHTSDGGTSWEAQNSNISGFLKSVSFIDSNKGWAVGYSNDTAYIINTTNGGEEWLIQKWDTNISLTEVCFIDESYGCAVGGYYGINGYSEGRILKTSDGGTTWEQQYCDTCEALNSVFFVDHDHGWVVGSSIYNTTDGGQNWTEQLFDTNGYSFTSIFFTDPQKGWIVGNKYAVYGGGSIILHTTDGGNTWSSKLYNTWLYSVHFKDNDNGLISGNNGMILLTDDGGITWGIQDSGTDNILYSICYTNDGQGYAAGAWGTIVHWDTLSLAADEFSDHISEIKLFNYPNPFRNQTNIQFTIPDPGTVKLKISDMNGRIIRTFTKERLAAGRHHVQWQVGNLNSGLYFIRLETNNNSVFHKTVIIK